MTTVVAEAGPWSAKYRTTTVGVFALAFLVAFEALAVATIMPIVADDLDGLPLYALSFAAPMAVAVISLTIGGPWMDRNGPGPSMRFGVIVFAAGLVIAGTAPVMVVFLIGRAVQGFGSGFIGVGLYVMIARVYPESLRPRVFTVLTSAWVLPALVGPAVAAFIADHIGWRWVFLSVPVIAVIATAMVWGSIHDLKGSGKAQTDRRRMGWALAAATGVLAISYAGQRTFALWPLLLALAIAVVVVFAPRLLPAGAWRARRGLPSVITVRGLLGASFFGAEVYLPLSLIEHQGMTPTQAGVVLTVAAVAWFSGSWLAANAVLLRDKMLRVRIGALAIAVGVASVMTTLNDTLPVGIAVAGWALAGAGMGMALSTLSVLLLDNSARGEEGINSSAIQINDSIVQALVLALGSVVFASFLDDAPMTGYVLVLSFSTALGILAVILSGRVAVTRAG